MNIICNKELSHKIKYQIFSLRLLDKSIIRKSFKVCLKFLVKLKKNKEFKNKIKNWKDYNYKIKSLTILCIEKRQNLKKNKTKMTMMNNHDYLTL